MCQSIWRYHRVRPLLQVVLSRIAYSIANREPIDTHFATEQIKEEKNSQRTKPNFIHFYGAERIENHIKNG